MKRRCESFFTRKPREAVNGGICKRPTRLTFLSLLITHEELRGVRLPAPAEDARQVMWKIRLTLHKGNCGGELRSMQVFSLRATGAVELHHGVPSCWARYVMQDFLLQREKTSMTVAMIPGSRLSPSWYLKHNGSNEVVCARCATRMVLTQGSL